VNTDDRAARRAVWVATLFAAMVSSVGFSRYELRPWEAVPLGLGAGLVSFALLVAAARMSRR